jgi:hypothetical protein
VFVTDRASLYIARTVAVPLPDAAAAAARMRVGSDPVRAVGLPGGGRVEMDLPFRRDAWCLLGRPQLAPVRTFGTLYVRAYRRVCDIEIELSPWSDAVSELSLRPAVRSPYQWGARRLQRWFTHAHDAADTLRSELLAWSATTPADVADEPVTSVFAAISPQ